MSDLACRGETEWTAECLEEDLRLGRTVLAFQGWTHSPARLLGRRRLISALCELAGEGTAVALQVSVTGLGGSAVEPGIGKTEEELSALAELREELGVPWEAVCVRIDPLQKYRETGGKILSNLESAPGVLLCCSILGVRRFRTSYIQYGRYRPKIEPRLEQRRLVPVELERDELRAACEDLEAVATHEGAELKSCAFELPELDAGACFDPAWFRALCSLPEQEMDEYWSPQSPVAPRKGCLCAHSTSVRMIKIPKRSSCFGRCAACYAQT
jgi:hypothetical protein